MTTAAATTAAATTAAATPAATTVTTVAETTKTTTEVDEDGSRTCGRSADVLPHFCWGWGVDILL